MRLLAGFLTSTCVVFFAFAGEHAGDTLSDSVLQHKAEEDKELVIGQGQHICVSPTIGEKLDPFIARAESQREAIGMAVSACSETYPQSDCPIECAQSDNHRSPSSVTAHAEVRNQKNTAIKYVLGDARQSKRSVTINTASTDVFIAHATTDLEAKALSYKLCLRKSESKESCSVQAARPRVKKEADEEIPSVIDLIPRFNFSIRKGR